MAPGKAKTQKIVLPLRLRFKARSNPSSSLSWDSFGRALSRRPAWPKTCIGEVLWAARGDVATWVGPDLSLSQLFSDPGKKGNPCWGRPS